MSMHTYIRIGAYALITHPPVKQMIQRFGCPNHEPISTGNFCPFCGTGLAEIEVEEICPADLDDLLPKSESLFQPEDVESLPTNTFVVMGNLGAVGDHLDEEKDVLAITQADIDRCIRTFEAGYAQELQILRDRATSVTIHFGVITYTMWTCIELGAKMQVREFTCAMCGGTFDCGWSEEEALAELQAVWGDVPPDHCDQVCDECWEKVKPQNNPDLFAAYQAEVSVQPESADHDLSERLSRLLDADADRASIDELRGDRNARIVEGDRHE